MNTRLRLWVGALLLVSAAAPLSAHHSFAAEFDRARPVSFRGVVTKVEWMNPHVWFYVDAKDADGRVVHWECEATNPNLLARNGWKRDSLKIGDEVAVQGFRAHCCDNVMNSTSIVLADGRKVFSGEAQR